MNRIISILASAALLFSLNACNQTNNKQTNQTEKIKKTQNLVYMSVDDLFAKTDSLENKTIKVEGIIEHVCKHGGKRFKIIDKKGKYELKIELGNEFPTVDATILGEKAKVIGKLISTQIDEKMVLKWEEKMKANHKGEEDTEHYKEELEFIQNIYKQITSGEIPYYTMYSIEAESYELE